ncbi:MAG: hypothetical protein WBG17_04515 [Burkholderiaceae bacterium]
MNTIDEQGVRSAEAYLRQVGQDHRLQAVAHLCTAYVANQTGMTVARAGEITAHAIADRSSRNTCAYVDLDRSTSRMVVVRDADGTRFGLPVSALLEAKKAHGIPIPR